MKNSINILDLVDGLFDYDDTLKGTTANYEIVKPLGATHKIIIKNGGDKIEGAITNIKAIDEIVEMMSRLIDPDPEYADFDCAGPHYSLEMYNEDDEIIDYISIWILNKVAAKPKSVQFGCGAYYLLSKDANSIVDIIKEAQEERSYDYDSICFE